MPGRDGTGPTGQGPGRGAERRGRRRARGMGLAGCRICPICGEKIARTDGVSRASTKRPRRGTVTKDPA